MRVRALAFSLVQLCSNSVTAAGRLVFATKPVDEQRQHPGMKKLHIHSRARAILDRPKTKIAKALMLLNRICAAKGTPSITLLCVANG